MVGLNCVTPTVPETNDPTWFKTFDLGYYSEEVYSDPIKVEVFNMKKKSLFSSEKEPELIGECYLSVE